MKRLSLVLAFVAVACDSEPARLQGDIQRYLLQVDLGFPVRVRSRVIIDVTEPGHCFTLATKNEPTEVTWNSEEPDSVTFEDGEVTVCGPAPADGRLAIEGLIEPPEAGPGEVGMRRLADDTVLLLGYLEGCDLFTMCDPRSDALVDLDIAVLNRSGRAVCGGEMTFNGTQTRCLMNEVPLYAGLTVAQSSGWNQFDFSLGDGRLVSMFVKTFESYQRIASELDFMVAFFETALGESPWSSLRIADVPFDWKGFEAPGFLLLRSSLVFESGGEYRDPLMHTIGHELVHQWAGIRRTLARPRDIVWKEAIAEYVTYRYETYRSETSAAQSRKFFDVFGTAAPSYPIPDDDVPLETLTETGYGAGTMALGVQLEAMLGPEPVLEAMRAFVAEPGASTTEDFIATLEATTGEDLDAYVAAWLVGSGNPERPTFTAESEAGEAKEIVVRVTQTPDVAIIFPCVVEVLVNGSAGSVVVPVSFGFDPTSREATATVDYDGVVESLDIDPDHRVMSFTP